RRRSISENLERNVHHRGHGGRGGTNIGSILVSTSRRPQRIACVAAVASLALSVTGRAAPAAPTFNKDIAPILLKKCADCHRRGQAAPMSLLTYDEVRPWAQSIRSKVRAREMPPWRADPRFGHFRNDPSLNASEIETIVTWVDAGATEGSAPLPAAPALVAGWHAPSGVPPAAPIHSPPPLRWLPAGITRPAARQTS